jgi:hypothetical protein
MESEQPNQNSNKIENEGLESIILSKRNSSKTISEEPAHSKEDEQVENLQYDPNGVKHIPDSESEELKSLVNQKLANITNYNSFSMAYITIISKLFRTFYQVFIKKLTNTLDQNKKIIKFFKEITGAYQRFSTDLLKANTAVVEVNQDLIFNNNINTMIEKTQETIANNFIGFSKVLQSNIVLKGPLAKIDEFYKRLSVIDKDIVNNFAKMQTKKEKIERMLNTKHMKLFEGLNKYFNDAENAHDIEKLNQILSGKNDLFLVEMETMGGFKGLFETISEFFSFFKSQMKLAIQLTSDYLHIIKESIEIYIGENKKIFSGQIDFNFESLQSFYSNISETLQTVFCPASILNDPVVIASFDQALRDFQTNFIKHDIKTFKDPSQSENLKIDENFKIEKFKTIDQFAEFFISFKPEITDGYHNSNLKVFEMEIKRDPGMFSSWKNCVLLITKQQNILLFDEEGTNIQFLDILKIENLKVKSKEEKKNPFRLEISEIKKGFMFDSNTSFKIDCCSREKYEQLTKLISNNSQSQNIKNSPLRKESDANKDVQEIKEDK